MGFLKRSGRLRKALNKAVEEKPSPSVVSGLLTDNLIKAISTVQGRDVSAELNASAAQANVSPISTEVLQEKIAREQISDSGDYYADVLRRMNRGCEKSRGSDDSDYYDDVLRDMNRGYGESDYYDRSYDSKDLYGVDNTGYDNNNTSGASYSLHSSVKPYKFAFKPR